MDTEVSEESSAREVRWETERAVVRSLPNERVVDRGVGSGAGSYPCDDSIESSE